MWNSIRNGNRTKGANWRDPYNFTTHKIYAYELYSSKKLLFKSPLSFLDWIVYNKSGAFL